MDDFRRTIEAGWEHFRAGRHEPAAAACEAVLRVEPNHPDALFLLGHIAQRRRDFGSAVAHFQRATRAAPRVPEFHNALGIALAEQGRFGGALAALDRAVAFGPALPAVHRNRGVTFARVRQLAAAAQAYRNALALDPSDTETWRDLTTALLQQGDAAGAIKSYERWVTLDPDNAAAHSDYVHALHYDPAVSRGRMREEAVRWVGRHADPLGRDTPPHTNEPNPDRPSRLGFVSADFRESPVARLMVPTLKYLDRSAFQTHCYSDARREDGTTAVLRKLSDEWRGIAGWSDPDVVSIIRGDGIDVLVDLGGHMSRRLTLFARRPAPVQITHFNYPDTTGMSAMTWRLTDSIAEPAGGDDPPDRYSVERLYRLEHCAWCYDPGPDLPTVVPLPALRSGTVTFGSLNKGPKHNPAVLALWARVLRAVPNSRLLLRAADATNVFARHVLSRHGVTPDRLTFAPTLSRSGYLDLYNQIDVALDPFPYNGGITSCDAMLMGVPLVALEGNTYHSRQGLMLLKNVGLGSLVARTEDEYVRIATELASDLPKLAELRANLRCRLHASPVMDGLAFARRFGDAVRAMWRDWCVRRKSSDQQ